MSKITQRKKKEKRLAKLRRDLFIAKINGERLSCCGCGHLLVIEDPENTAFSLVKCGKNVEIRPIQIYGTAEYWRGSKNYTKNIYVMQNKCDAWHVASTHTLLQRLENARNKNKVVEPLSSG